MYPGVELRLYRYVAVLAEELNFTRAAARLHVAQPSLSPLAATLMTSPISVASKELTGSLSPLDSTLTKNRGVGV